MDKPDPCFIRSLCLIALAICLDMEITHFMNNLQAIDMQVAIESPAYDRGPDSSIDSEGDDFTPPVIWVTPAMIPSKLAATDVATSISSIPSGPLLPPPKSV